MTTVQVISVIFLFVMVVLIFRGIRGHPRRHELMELDATGNAIGHGAMRMAERLETETITSSDGAGGGD